jgi:hypothetical protein
VFFDPIRVGNLLPAKTSSRMIDHLGGGQGFVDPLRLARKINQELHTVGLNIGRLRS